MSSLLTVNGLRVDVPIGRTMSAILRGIDLTIRAGESVGLVGESGSGKSMTARAIAGLLPAHARLSGSIQLDGQEVTTLRGAALRRIRTDVAMIFQDPRSHINPIHRIGDYLTEPVVSSGVMSAHAARTRALELLDAVRLSDPSGCLRQYPHELSGGMLQRVMIAGALMSSPRLVLADEPTTALDVTTQAEVMSILRDLLQTGSMGLLFISHDLELAAAVCDRTAVMYAGQIVEVGASRTVDDDPRHPYTAALARARPRVDQTVHRLAAIPGQPLSAVDAPPQECSFAPRCAFAVEACRQSAPDLHHLDGSHTRCLRAVELRGRLAGAS